jgi:three-Cys-motif partner protein
MPIHDRLPDFKQDGLITPEVGEWGQEKYLRVWMYDELFATGMKKKWPTRVYIDLFSGAGAARLRTSGRRVPGSPLLALQLQDPFDRYIFCEQDEEKMDALQRRVAHVAPGADVRFVPGDVNARVDEVESHIPTGKGVLTFCFVDPYSLRIRFHTLKRLSTGRPMDFLVLLALQMDARRNFDRYVAEETSKLDAFLGNGTWRDRWKAAERGKSYLIQFLAEEYTRSMEQMGYLSNSTDRMYLVKTDEKRLPIYYLAFFSKHKRGYEFWDQVLKYSTEQTSLLTGLGL